MVLKFWMIVEKNYDVINDTTANICLAGANSCESN